MPIKGFRHTDASKRKMSENSKSKIPFEERFWGKVDKNGPIHPVLKTKCWLWTAGILKSGFGYGQVKACEEHVAHRVSWKLSGKEIPEGLLVLHKCDNPLCVNPSHLFIGTYKDNVKDMDEKGRRVSVHGEKHHFSRLTEELVKKMRSLYAKGKFGYKRLAKLFNISPMTAARAIRRESWKHI